MSIYIEESNEHKVVCDDLNGRIYGEEWKCNTCKEWVDADDVVWCLPNGELNTINGNAYCVGCCPEQPDYEANKE